MRTENKSLNQSVNEGATDGKYRKVRPNTTVAPGTGEDIPLANRRGLHPSWNYDVIDQGICFRRPHRLHQLPRGSRREGRSGRGRTRHDSHGCQLVPRHPDCQLFPDDGAQHPLSGGTTMNEPLIHVQNLVQKIGSHSIVPSIMNLKKRMLK